jgi:hypothetical protein
MLSYASLDAIADFVNPTIGVLAFLFPWLRRRGARYALMLNGLTVLGVVFAYALQAVDAQLRVWPSMGLDYSTHTAVYVAIGSSLWQHGRWLRMAAVVLGGAYAALMLYQRYHSWLDITSTALVMLIPLVALWWWWQGRSKASEALA